ncbi:septum formation protein [Balneicella halophila]|uniref:dTTP/UTP pyrophosphatase n=1 Tax=Balneicella halophila TaxID=1537566 RepID=A0A7L4US43_BALHA|nr:Maf family nucleotide pyrophosphatase [Balneicella halophila]PVX52027.1 septum formation protein [Balneicella halophila]
MLLHEKLKGYQLILASQSPRREMLMKQLGLQFDIIPLSIDESYPKELLLEQVPEYLAKKKAEPFVKNIQDKQIVVTSDTVVILYNELLGKPKNKKEAKKLLHKLSGQTHEVISGVCITTKHGQVSKSVSSKVSFKPLSDEEIDYYIEKFEPLDKAGAYGVQEWIGYVAIERIDGSYSNIVGLPTATIYEMLKEVAG